MSVSEGDLVGVSSQAVDYCSTVFEMKLRLEIGRYDFMSDRQTERQKDRQTNRRTDGPTNGRADGRADNQTDGQRDTDRQTHTHIDRRTKTDRQR